MNRLAGALILASVSVFFLSFSVGRTVKNEQVENWLDRALETRVQRREPPPVSRQVEPAELEKLALFIKPKDYDRIRGMRANSLKKGYLGEDEKKYVSAILRYQDRSFRARIRLKGDLGDHRKTNKWSYRVRIRDDEALMGMREFSIQSPATRSYLAEWLFQKVLEAAGLISHRYGFLKVEINGKYYGIYAYEEHFRKELIENQSRREGPIVRFNDVPWWERQMHRNRHQDPIMAARESSKGGSTYYSVNVLPFGMSSTRARPELWNGFLVAQDLLEGLRAGRLRSSEVFDTQKLARYFAVSNLFGGRHGEHTNQFRFYYNPVLSKLEIVPYDSMTWGRKFYKFSSRYDFADAKESYNNGTFLFIPALLSDPEVEWAYMSELSRLVDTRFVQQFFEANDPEISKMEGVLKKEFPDAGLDRSKFYELERTVAGFLKPKEAIRVLKSEFSADGRSYLEVYNFHNLPVEVEIDGKWRRVSERRSDLYIHDARFVVSGSFSEKNLKYRILGTKRVLEEKTHPWSDLGHLLVEKKGRLEKWFRDTGGSLRFTAKNVTLTESLVIPSGKRLVVSKGTRIDFVRGAKIVSYSPIEIAGTKESPVELFSSDGLGEGLLVIAPQSLSTLAHMKVSNLVSPRRGFLYLDSPISFYSGRVRLENCEFSGNRKGKRALSLLGARFDLKNSRFMGTFADAVFVAQSTGKLSSIDFRDIGHDGLVVSGSRVEASALRFQNIRERGVLVDSRSRVSVDAQQFRNVKYPIMVRGGSEIDAVGADLSLAEVGISVLEGAEARLRQMQTRSVSTPYLVEKGARFVLGAKSLPNREKNLRLRLPDLGINRGRNVRDTFYLDLPEYNDWTTRNLELLALE